MAGHLVGMASRHREAHRRCPGGQLARSVHRDVVHLEQPGQEGPEAGLLGRGDPVESRVEEERRGGPDRRDRLERCRARLPTLRRGVGRGPHLVGRERVAQVRGEPQHAGVRAVPLVRRGEERVAVERGEVDGRVRDEMDPVDQHPCTGRVGRVDDRREVGHRAQRVRRTGDRDPSRPWADARRDRVGIEASGGGVELRQPQDGTTVVGREAPRRDVGVVVEPGAHDLVTRRPVARERPREREVERGHVGAEDDALRIGAQQPAHAATRVVDHAGRRARRCEPPVPVRVVARAQEVGERVDRAVDHLGAGGSVEARPFGADAGESIAHASKLIVVHGDPERGTRDAEIRCPAWAGGSRRRGTAGRRRP